MMDIAAVRSPIDSGLCSNTEAKLNPGTLQQSSVQFSFILFIQHLKVLYFVRYRPYNNTGKVTTIR